MGVYLGTSSSRPSIVTSKSVVVTFAAKGYSIFIQLYLVFLWFFVIIKIGAFAFIHWNFVIEIFASICSWDFMKL